MQTFYGGGYEKPPLRPFLDIPIFLKEVAFMAIEPIGVGLSGMDLGHGGFSGGMNVYRKAAANINGIQNEKWLPPLSENGGKVGKNGKNAAQNGRISDEADRKRRFDSYECQTCKNRKYQDGSDDSGVSFQTPTRVDPKAAASKVRSHEQEHVSRNQAKADREGNEIVSQSVTIHTGICPECGKVYVSGGTTKTITKSGNNDDRFNVGMFDPTGGKGNLLNKTA